MVLKVMLTSSDHVKTSTNQIWHNRLPLCYHEACLIMKTSRRRCVNVEWVGSNHLTW